MGPHVRHEVKPEARLKAAVIDRLFAASHVDDDAVLVSEMVVENWSRRADVVLANGRLWGFEIKSELDSLSRLPGQIESFGRSFEKLTIVVAARFEERVRDMIPDAIGLWVEGSDGLLRERVRPRTTQLGKAAAIRLMTAAELRHLLSCNGALGLGSAPRTHLEELAAYLPSADLANAARAAIKQRHRSRHQAFTTRRITEGTVAALDQLRRPRVAAFSSAEPSPQPTSVARGFLSAPLGHPALIQAPAGAVLKRVPR